MIVIDILPALILSFNLVYRIWRHSVSTFIFSFAVAVGSFSMCLRHADVSWAIVVMLLTVAEIRAIRKKGDDTW